MGHRLGVGRSTLRVSLTAPFAIAQISAHTFKMAVSRTAARNMQNNKRSESAINRLLNHAPAIAGRPQRRGDQQRAEVVTHLD
jgi:hypothetical protein